MKIRFVKHTVTPSAGMTVATACKDGANTVLECDVLPTVWCAGGGLGGFQRTSTTIMDKLDGNTGSSTSVALTSAGHAYCQSAVYPLMSYFDRICSMNNRLKNYVFVCLFSVPDSRIGNSRNR